MAITLLVASPDEHFRESVRESLLNIPNSRVAAEYPEVSTNLYIRVLQDIERYAGAGLILDLASGVEASLKILEKVKQAAPHLYVIAANYSSDGETVIASLRSGANDFILQPLKRIEFRDAIARFERAPKHTASGGASRLGKVYTFLGAKGGVGTTALAVNFAGVLAQRKHNTVLLDLDWTANDCALQVGASPQYTLQEVGENLARMDQALFEGFVTRDPLGFILVGPPDVAEQPANFSEPMLREFSTFLVEKYDSIVVDAGRILSDETVLGMLHSSTTVFLVLTQDLPAIRNAQRFIAGLMRLGFTQDQLRIVLNRYSKNPPPGLASLEQVQQTLNQPVFYGIPSSPAVLAAINRGRPLVSDRAAAPEFDRAFRAFVDKATGAKSEAKTA